MNASVQFLIDLCAVTTAISIGYGLWLARGTVAGIIYGSEAHCNRCCKPFFTVDFGEDRLCSKCKALYNKLVLEEEKKLSKTKKCDSCNGSGKIKRYRCIQCNGHGSVKVDPTVLRWGAHEKAKQRPEWTSR